jgi:hypothetical protein
LTNVSLNDEDLDHSFSALQRMVRLLKREGSKSPAGMSLRDAIEDYAEFVSFLAARLGHADIEEKAGAVARGLSGF